MSRPWQDDDDMLSEIAAEAHRAVLPDAVRRAAHRAFAHRAAAGGVLATLSYDSLLDVFQVRSDLPDGGRILSFEAGDLSVEVEILGDGLTGQLVPPAPGRVQLITLEGVAAEATADELGRFQLARPPAGPVRFRCDVGGDLVLTDWVQVY